MSPWPSRIGATLVAVAALLAGGQAASADTVLRVGAAGDPDSLDPARAYARESLQVLANTGGGLVSFRREAGRAGAEIVPMLAREIPTPTARRPASRIPAPIRGALRAALRTAGPPERREGQHRAPVRGRLARSRALPRDRRRRRVRAHGARGHPGPGGGRSREDARGPPDARRRRHPLVAGDAVRARRPGGMGFTQAQPAARRTRPVLRARLSARVVHRPRAEPVLRAREGTPARNGGPDPRADRSRHRDDAHVDRAGAPRRDPVHGPRDVAPRAGGARPGGARPHDARARAQHAPSAVRPAAAPAGGRGGDQRPRPRAGARP